MPLSKDTFRFLAKQAIKEKKVYEYCLHFLFYPDKHTSDEAMEALYVELGIMEDPEKTAPVEPEEEEKKKK